MQLLSARWLLVPLVALPLVACGGTVVFEEDGSSDGGGGRESVGPTGSGGSPTTTAAQATSSSGSPTATASSGNPVTASTAVGVTVGVTVGSVTTGGQTCDGELFGDPGLDACSRDFCCAEMGVCLASPSSCFDESGQFAKDLPAGFALYDCLVQSGCLVFNDTAICDSGLAFGDTDPETVELARCLSDNCCQEFNDCTSDGADAQPCIDCLNGEGDDDLCRPAVECANAICGAGF